MHNEEIFEIICVLFVKITILMKIDPKMAIFGTFACPKNQQKVDISDILFHDCAE